jgi:hypothetical protein
MFEIDDEGPSRVLPALRKHRDGSAASRAVHRVGYALLASALLLACIDEPGAPSDDGSSDDDSEVEFEVLGFQKAASSSGVETRVYSPETTTGTFGGMASADVNRDGADDLFILGHKTRAGSETGAELLLNKGNGLFEDASDWLPPLSLFASGPLFADLDLNGSPYYSTPISGASRKSKTAPDSKAISRRHWEPWPQTSMATKTSTSSCCARPLRATRARPVSCGSMTVKRTSVTTATR